MKAYYWLAYPALVLVVILFSSIFLFGSLGLWSKINLKSEEVKKLGETEKSLQTKLSRLQAANPTVEEQNFNYLVSVLPANKNLPVLLAQVSQAATASGVTLAGFKGQVGNISVSESAVPSDALRLEITLETSGFDSLREALTQFETSLPLLSVASLKFAGTQTVVVVQSEWQPLAQLPAGAEYAIPETAADIAKIREQLSNYNSLPAVSSEVPVETGVNSNPF